jgi:hypothetical protein
VANLGPNDITGMHAAWNSSNKDALERLMPPLSIRNSGGSHGCISDGAPAKPWSPPHWLTKST